LLVSQKSWIQLFLVFSLLFLTLLSLNSIHRTLLAWEIYVNIAKASEVDNIQKWKTIKMNSKHYIYWSSKRIKTLQMSYYVCVYIHSVVTICKWLSTKGKINKHKYGLYWQWCLYFTGCLFLAATGHKSCCCDCTLWYFTQ
jgi:hypothetical protein